MGNSYILWQKGHSLPALAISPLPAWESTLPVTPLYIELPHFPEAFAALEQGWALHRLQPQRESLSSHVADRFGKTGATILSASRLTSRWPSPITIKFPPALAFSFVPAWESTLPATHRPISSCDTFLKPLRPLSKGEWLHRLQPQRDSLSSHVADRFGKDRGNYTMHCVRPSFGRSPSPLYLFVTR